MTTVNLDSAYVYNVRHQEVTFRIAVHSVIGLNILWCPLQREVEEVFASSYVVPREVRERN